MNQTLNQIISLFNTLSADDQEDCIGAMLQAFCEHYSFKEENTELLRGLFK